MRLSREQLKTIEAMRKADQEVLAISPAYQVWKTESWDMIMLRDVTHPDQITDGDARSPDLFFKDINQVKELRNVLTKTINKLKKEK